MTAKKYSIGRSPANDIFVDQRSVSKQHCVLITEDHVHFELIDNSAAHGVYVLGQSGPVRVQRERVELDTKVLIGDYETTVGDLLAQAGIHPDVFVSYSHEDRDRSNRIASFLTARGLRMWWDDRLAVAVPFDDQLEDRLTKARCVAVLWSRHSVRSQWVRAEAGVALERGVLIPVFIDDIEAPVLFRQIQGHFVTAWNTPALDEQLDQLAHKITVFLSRAR